MKEFFLTCGLILVAALTRGQTVTADFTINSTACLNENLKPDNQSINATRYEWDFCQGDLATTPEASAVTTVGGNITVAVDVVFDGTNWYGFVTSQNTNSLLRLDFGSDVFSTPTVTDLGNIDNKTNAPVDVKVVNDNGNWYAFVYNLSDPMISRINFGSSLANTTSSSSPVTADAVLPGAGTTNGGFDMMYDGTNWTLVTTNNSVFTVARMPSITGVPAGGDIISAVSNPHGFDMGDITLAKSNGNFFGYVISRSNKSLQRLSFGASLFSTPTVDDISVPFLASYSPFGLDIGYDDNNYNLFVSSSDGNVIRIALGSDLSVISASATLAGNFPIFENTLKIKLIKDKTSWLTFSTSWQSSKLYRLAFQNPSCNTIVQSESPVFSFADQSQKAITLRAFNNTGGRAETTKVVNVTSGTAPQAGFSISGVCTTSASQFDATSEGNVVSYEWDFGDGTNATGQSVSHQYTAGAYDVTLVATGSNGCTNSFFESTKAYDRPVPDFSTPGGLVCTNNEFSFTNLTPDNFDGLLTYEWSVDGSVVGTDRNLNFAFTAQGDNDVTLKVSIPGCFDELTKTVNNVQPGPTVGFTFIGNCQSDEYAFTNTSAGDIASYSWDFSDGDPSGDVDPTHVYEDPGTYEVTLSTTGVNGCVSTTRKTVNVYSLPVPSFSVDLPPFSCSGSPTQFHDGTQPPTDSNLDQWNWSFGDNSNGAGKDPTHTYAMSGAFNVRLSVTTDRGCSASVEQQVNISQSPIASFDASPTCVNQPTVFTNSTPDEDVKSWMWKVGSATYNTKDATHKFAAPGSNSVQLVVTGNNNCVSTITKNITVPVVPVVEFLATKGCSGQAVTFSDVTSSVPDPVSTRSWSLDGIIVNGEQVEHTFATAGTYPVKLEIKNQSGCVYSTTKQVTIDPTPVADFNMSIQSGPPPLHVSFTNTSTGATSYKWNFNDSNPPKTDVSTEYTFNALGSYEIELTATNAEGCSGAVTKTVSVIVPLNELALEEFSLVPMGSGYRGYVRVRNNGNYRISGFSVSYDVGGGMLLQESVTAAINPGQSSLILLSNQFSSPSSGSYVCAELQSDTNDLDNKACTVLNDNSVILAPYPNPTITYLNVETIQSSSGVVHLRLYNSAGQNTFDKEFDVAAGLATLTLNVEHLSPGMYVLVITAGQTTTSRHILIGR